MPGIGCHGTVKPPYFIASLAVLLAGVLLVSSWRTLGALDEQQTVYLRGLAADVASRLETQTGGAPDDSGDAGVLVITRGGPSDLQDLAGLWDGQQLYRTEILAGRERVFRAYVPFHSPAGLRVARIDLPFSAAGFLLVEARRNVIAAAASSVALVFLAIWVIWSARRAALSEKRRLELEHMAQIGEMASVLAHEIRNPLGTIKGYAQLAVEQTGPETHSLLNPILQETGRLERLVNDLLAYGRPPHPHRRAVSWAEIASALASEWPDVSIGEAALTLAADPDLVREVLLNLLRNAREASATEIVVRCREVAQGSVEIEVEDNGTGLPEGLGERAFQPFFTTKAFGTGLGLAISRRLARALGGDLTLEAGRPGGTRAHLRLPAWPASGTAIATSGRREKHGIPSGR